jgi:hypothetical protein
VGPLGRISSIGSLLERVGCEETCSGWYLYVADYCLTLKRHGCKVYVLPNEIYHKSTGPADREVYGETVSNMIRKHREHVPTIYTTVGEWPTDTSNPAGCFAGLKQRLKTLLRKGTEK